ncbi:MAG: SRPBCC family protein [Bacteroidota bacterium]
MALIQLHTTINADKSTCFNQARSVETHLASTKKTGERVVAGRKTGLFEVDDIVTWEATHFGIKQQLTVQITKMDFPFSFEDKMLKGAFKYMRHEHHFKTKDGKTIMSDHFEFSSPLGILGQIFDFLILKRYMTRFLIKRNAVIKELAENSKQVF